ncbi:hypothetical protein R3P38DRAFT_2776990 [Favolaschia claudopus]|uniref:Secreted protein n=1 Tax=Favolaschia claudopus TaxID=2862362 RepID=A0AAW0BNK6_9AGAR
MKFSLSSLAMLSLALPGAFAQGACGNIAAQLVLETNQINSFFNQKVPPSTTDFSSCQTAKKIKTGIDAFRSSEISNPQNGCAGAYGVALLQNPTFEAAYEKLGKFVGACH